MPLFESVDRIMDFVGSKGEIGAMKKITILGSTGSIGTQALDVVRAQHFAVSGLAAHSSIERLEQQARAFLPDTVCIYRKDLYKKLKDNLADTGIRVTAGMEGLCSLAAGDRADIVLNAVVGMIGLQPTLAAIAAKKDVALANKETLVTGGEIVMRAAAENGVKILPVDSEHSAIFQALQGNRADQVNRIILTASGGPFYGYTSQQLSAVKPEDALKHPNWNMGAKITIDSATLMNKGLELIEAVRLFGKQAKDIQIVVHRESVLHSAVEYNDYSIIAQLGVPDMRIPIQYALTYPDRLSCPTKQLSLMECGKLTFAEPDGETFICLKACKEAITRGGLYPTVVNGANEQAVALFLENKISFTDIGRLVLESLDCVACTGAVTVENIIATDAGARAWVLQQTGWPTESIL